MPRAKLEDLQGFQTTSAVAEALGLSAYLIKARINDGTLPPASRVSDSGVLLFDDEWMAAARDLLNTQSLRRRRRETRVQNANLPSPESVLGHVPGEEGWIPTWQEMLTYFQALDEASPRVTVETLGTSTLGKPYIVVAISAPENLQSGARERNAELLGKLWDPGDLTDAEIDAVIEEARTVGIILATQHSTEIGAALMTLQLAYELAGATDAATEEMLQNSITLLVPSHNPDGIDMIAEWYDKVRDTEYIGADLPFLYHPYTGHDNNRDWFMMTQAETRLFVDLHNQQHPQAVFDMHQMGRYGARFMVPPFIDPLDPNQNAVIQQGFATLGTHIAQRLTAAGKAGVVTNAIFDNFSPSLAYGNYHGSVDLLSEAASANLATSVTIKESELRDADGFNPLRRSWNHPVPWEGGTWTLAEIVDYNLIAARSMMEHLAAFRRQWLQDYRLINAAPSERDEKPFAFVVPEEQRDPGTAAELLELLQRGLVDVHVATDAFEMDGIAWPAGTRVVRLDQPAGSFAKTLLEVQTYPNLRRWRGGPPLPPYDVVGHTLPMQMGVRVVPVDRPIPDGLPLEKIAAPIEYRGEVALADAPVKAWLFDERTNASVAAVQDLLSEQVPVYRAKQAYPEAGIRAGAIVVPAAGVEESLVREIAEGTGTDVVPVTVDIEIEAYQHRPVRLGVYRSTTAPMDEGWARWVLEEFGFEYTTLLIDDVRRGHLRDRFDAILIPHMSPKHLREGQEKYSREDEPNLPENVRGLGALGIDELRRFADAGGTIISIDASTSPIVEDMGLPVRLPLNALTPEEFFCPGSLLRVIVDSDHPLGYGLPRELPVLFMRSTVFDPSRGAEMIAHYPQTNPLMSGWLLGEERLHGKGALVETPYGEGRVVLIGFRPYFRAQTRGTYRVLFNAIARAGYSEASIRLD